MKTRTIEEIEEAFREMGLSESTWGKILVTEPVPVEDEHNSEGQIFIRIENTTKPMENPSNAHLA